MALVLPWALSSKNKVQMPVGKIVAIVRKIRENPPFEGKIL
jgi:hypothetical protein